MSHFLAVLLTLLLLDSECFHDFNSPLSHTLSVGPKAQISSFHSTTLVFSVALGKGLTIHQELSPPTKCIAQVVFPGSSRTKPPVNGGEWKEPKQNQKVAKSGTAPYLSLPPVL